MGLLPDEDIVSEMRNLIGPEALELTISRDSIINNKKKVMFSFNDSGLEGDESSVNSKSQSERTDKHSEHLFKMMEKKTRLMESN